MGCNSSSPSADAHQDIADEPSQRELREQAQETKQAEAAEQARLEAEKKAKAEAGKEQARAEAEAAEQARLEEEQARAEAEAAEQARLEEEQARAEAEAAEQARLEEEQARAEAEAEEKAGMKAQPEAKVQEDAKREETTQADVEFFSVGQQLAVRSEQTASCEDQQAGPEQVACQTYVVSYSEIESLTLHDTPHTLKRSKEDTAPRPFGERSCIQTWSVDAKALVEVNTPAINAVNVYSLEYNEELKKYAAAAGVKRRTKEELREIRDRYRVHNLLKAKNPPTPTSTAPAPAPVPVPVPVDDMAPVDDIGP